MSGRVGFVIAVAFASAVLAQGPPPFVRPPEELTVTVDCRRGDSLQEALDKEARRLIVNLRGECAGGVVVSHREIVELRGTSSTADGIIGSPAPFTPALAVTHVREFKASNISFRGATGDGLTLDFVGRSTIDSCRAEDNRSIGVSVIHGSAYILGSTIDRNGTGIGAQQAEIVDIRNSTLTDNSFSALAAVHSLVITGGMDVSGAAEGAICGTACRLYLQVGQIRSTAKSALTAINGGEIYVTGNVKLFGRVNALWKSVLNFAGAEVNGSLEAQGNSFVHIGGSTQINANILMNDFSNLRIFLAHPSVNGSIACRTGSQAVCDRPDRISGTVSGCGPCVKP